jgi:DNA-binding MurR/RpiR family transcriptional regulator
MERNIFEKIESKIPVLTSKQKLIAMSILQNPLPVAFSTVKEYAVKTSISPASIVRFSQEVCGGGFPQLQQEIQEYIQSISNPIKRLELNVTSNSADDTLLTQIYDTQLNNLRHTFNQSLIFSVKKAAALISEGEHIYTTGSRGSFSIAYYLSHHLNRISNNADVISDNDRLAEFIHRVTERDVVIFVCLPRYNARLLTVAKHLHEKGTKIITLNGSQRSPFVAFSDVVFIANYQSNDFHNSLLSCMLIAEMLISLVISKNVSSALDALDYYEPIFTELGQFSDTK